MYKHLFVLLCLGIVTGLVASENDALLSAAIRSKILTALNAGAEPDDPDLDGRTALHAAADGGHQELVELLIMRGLSVDQPDSSRGTTPLMLATKPDRCAIAQLLLQHRANVNAPDQTGWTPLINAAWWGNDDTVKLLLACQADINVKNSRGKTAHGEASHAGHHTTAQLLLAAKASPE